MWLLVLPSLFRNKLKMSMLFKYIFSWGKWGKMSSLNKKKKQNKSHSGHVYSADGIRISIQAVILNAMGYLLKLNWHRLDSLC